MNTIQNRIGIVITLVLILFTGTAAHAAAQNYEIQVEGMHCAYCAYSVSKNLAALDGVVDESVHVNLERGVATLQSTRTLDHSQIKETFLDSGFTAADISLTADASIVASPTAQVAKITLDRDQIGSKMVDQLLDVLGETAVKGSSELHILAPQALETDILKLLIAGRQRAIKVRYETTDDTAVVVTLYQ